MNVNRVKNGIANRVYKYINSHRGWKTNRKIVVIESDDWGSIRMPSRAIYETILKKQPQIDSSVFNKYDSIASKDDFEHLYTVLSKHKDKNSSNPIITANTIVANPDFNKIEESNFIEYHFETFLETLRKYPNHSFNMWEEGINNKLFHPQLHGREHLNVNKWMQFLKNKDCHLHFLFKLRTFGVHIDGSDKSEFIQALKINQYTSIENTNEFLEEAAKLFKTIFGYTSESFIAPNYIWSKDNETKLSDIGVKYLQGHFIQLDSLKGKIYHYLGQENKSNQIYLTRNVIFEPSSDNSKHWINSCLKEIQRVFSNKKPAIICVHRVNFIGGIFEKNRVKNIKLLDELLSKIIRKWPDVEFLTTDQLGKLINEEQKLIN